MYQNSPGFMNPIYLGSASYHQPEFTERLPTINQIQPADNINIQDPYIPQVASQPTQGELKLEKDYRFLKWVIPLILAFFCLLFSSVLAQRHQDPAHQITNAEQVFQMLKRNLKQSPIVAITIRKQSETCPNDYEQYSFGSWAGVESGCLCADGVARSYTECLKNWKNCKRVPGFRSQPLNYWIRRTGAGQRTTEPIKFCLKRNSDWKISHTNECSGDYKWCFNRFCVNTKEECPISRIKAYPKSESNEFMQQIYQTFANNLNRESSTSFLTLSKKDFQFTYDRTSERYPMIDLEISTQDEVCYEGNKYPKTISGSYYPLSKKPASGCGKYGATQEYYQTLDQENIKTVYTVNDLDSTIQKIPSYYEFVKKNDEFKLLAAYRIQLGNSPVCQSVGRDKTLNILQNSQSLRTVEYILSILIIVLSLAIILFLIIFYIVFENVLTQKAINKRKGAKNLLILGIILSGFCIGAALYYYYQSNLIAIQQINLLSFINGNCFLDARIEAAALEIHKYSLISVKFMKFLVLGLLVTGIVYLVFATILLVLDRKQLQGNSQISQNPSTHQQ